MSNVVINDSHLIDIGNAIREKAKTDDRYKPRDMAEAILSIQGGATIIPPEAGTLTGIVISKLPNKIDYNAGESINLEGLEVTSQYDNGVTGIVTDACTIEVETPLVKEETKVLVTYEGFSTSFIVNVYSQPLEVPPGTIYLYHFEDNLNNEIISSNGTIYSRDITYSVGKFHSKCLRGTTTSCSFYITHTSDNGLPTRTELRDGVAATYEGWFKNTNTQLTSSSASSAKTLMVIAYNLTLQHYSNNTYQFNGVTAIGDSYNDWVHVAVVFKGGVAKVFVNGKKIIETTLGASTGMYREFKAIESTTTLHVDEILISTEALYEEDFIPPTGPYGGKRILQKLIVESQPTKTLYKSGEEFSLNGAVIKAVYSNGLQVDVTKECQIDDNVMQLGDKLKKISYTEDNITKDVFINVGVYIIEPELDLSATKLLMNFDTNCSDITGINTPTIIGNDLYGIGKFGQARHFNGSTDYISIPYTDNINIDTGDFTIAYWVAGAYKTENANSVFLSIGDMLTSSSVLGLRMGIYPNRGVFTSLSKDANGTSITVTTGSPIIDEGWNHIALVRKDDKITLYVNGKIVNSVTYTGRLYNGNTLKIGARFNQNGAIDSPLLGYIDDFILTKSALWDGEFTPPTKAFSIGG